MSRVFRLPARFKPGDLVWVRSNPGSGTWCVEEVIPVKRGFIDDYDLVLVNQTTPSSETLRQGFVSLVEGYGAAGQDLNTEEEEDIVQSSSPLREEVLEINKKEDIDWGSDTEEDFQFEEAELMKLQGASPTNTTALPDMHADPLTDDNQAESEDEVESAAEPPKLPEKTPVPQMTGTEVSSDDMELTETRIIKKRSLSLRKTENGREPPKTVTEVSSDDEKAEDTRIKKKKSLSLRKKKNSSRINLPILQHNHSAYSADEEEVNEAFAEVQPPLSGNDVTEALGDVDNLTAKVMDQLFNTLDPNILDQASSLAGEVTLDFDGDVIEANKVLHSTMDDECSVFPGVPFEETSQDFFIPYEKCLKQSNASEHSDGSRGIKRVFSGGDQITPEKFLRKEEHGNGDDTAGQLKEEIVVDEQSGREAVDSNFDSFELKNLRALKEVIESVRDIAKEKNRSVDFNVNSRDKINEELKRVWGLMEQLAGKKTEIETAVAYQNDSKAGQFGGIEVDNLEEVWHKELKLFKKREAKLKVMLESTDKLEKDAKYMDERIRFLYRKLLGKEAVGKTKEVLSGQMKQCQVLKKELNQHKTYMDQVWQYGIKLNAAFNKDLQPLQDEVKEACGTYAEVLKGIVVREEEIEKALNNVPSEEELVQRGEKVKSKSLVDIKTAAPDEDAGEEGFVSVAGNVSLLSVSDITFGIQNDDVSIEVVNSSDLEDSIKTASTSRNKSTVDRAEFKIPGDRAERGGKLLTRDEVDDLRRSTEGVSQTKRKDRLVACLKESMRYYGEEREIGDLPNAVLDQHLATFWWDYKRATDGEHPDTSSLESYFSSLNKAVTRLRGGRDPNKEPSEFPLYMDMKTSKMRVAKKVKGNGLGANVVDVLYAQEVRHFLDSGLVNATSAWGINRGILIQMICGVSQRPILDQKRMPLDAVQITRDENGVILYADVVLQFSKTDHGDKIVAGKGPRIMPIANKHRCFFTYWDRLLFERKKLGPEWLEGSSPLFLQPRNTKEFEKNDCLFHPKAMSEDAIGSMVKNMAIEANLNLTDPPRKITNMSLRQLNFHQHIALDITPEQSTLLSGHQNAKTRKRYLVKNQDQQEVMGAAMIATTTGSPAILPVPAGVRAIQHLKGPKTSRDLSDPELVGTVLEVGDQPEGETTVEPGASVQDMFFRNDIYFDGVLKPRGISLPAAYNLHISQKYQARARTEEDEEDMLKWLGPPSPDCPPLPVLGEQGLGIEVIKAPGDGPRYGADSLLAWKPPHLRKATAKEEQDLDSDDSADDPSWSALKEFNGRVSKEKKKPQAKAKNKKQEPVLKEGSLVFAREPKAKGGRMWPSAVKDSERYKDNNGVVTSYLVQFFCHPEYPAPTAVLKVQVKAVDKVAMKKWSSPSFCRRAGKKDFEQGMLKMKEELTKLGLEFLMPESKALDDHEAAIGETEEHKEETDGNKEN